MATIKKAMTAPVLLCLGIAIFGMPINAIADDHMSNVYLEPQNDTIVNGEVDGEHAIIAETGKPLQAKIGYWIGWFSSQRAGGRATQISSDISDPEYELLFYDSEDQNPSPLPAGVSFSAATGVLSGTPSVSGVWNFHPSVRDKKHGESPYDGKGIWWTVDAKFNGKTWISAKDKTTLVILPAPSGKEVKLQCSGQYTGGYDYQHFSSFDALVEVDYERGIVKLFGNNGKIAGVYHATINDDFIAWGKTSNPAFSSVKIDRKTGAITAPVPSELSPAIMKGNCQKRTTEQKF